MIQFKMLAFLICNLRMGEKKALRIEVIMWWQPFEGEIINLGMQFALKLGIELSC